MLIKKVWIARRKTALGSYREWIREGGYLFGIIPLYIRDLEVRKRG